jgi:hypothetical protein
MRWEKAITGERSGKATDTRAARHLLGLWRPHVIRTELFASELHPGLFISFGVPAVILKTSVKQLFICNFPLP